MNDSIRNAAADVRRQLEEKAGQLRASPLLGEVLQLHQALNALEGIIGGEKTPLATVLGFTVPSGEHGEASVPSHVRFDEFFGVPALQAAKRYLKKCADARPFAEIVDAIRRGGGKIENEEDLRTGLTRSTLDIVKIGERYGALEKYDHIKRSGRKKKGATETGPVLVSPDRAADVLETSGTEPDEEEPPS